MVLHPATLAENDSCTPTPWQKYLAHLSKGCIITVFRLSINDVGNWEGEGSKIGQNFQWIVLKTADMGGVKNPEKLPTSFMDGSYCNNNKQVTLLAANK